MQLALIIIFVMFNSLTFFALGYFLGNKEKKTTIAIMDDPKDAEVIIESDRTVKNNTSPPTVGYPKSGIRSTFTIDEPSGPVMRPTAAELRKMEEDEIIRENKEAVAEVFKNEKPPEV